MQSLQPSWPITLRIEWPHFYYTSKYAALFVSVRKIVIVHDGNICAYSRVDHKSYMGRLGFVKSLVG